MTAAGKRIALAVTVLIVCLLAGWGSLLAGRRVLFFGDIALYFVPLLDLQRGELLKGRIVLWNPDVLCGTPLVGNPQAWSLYPSSLLLFLFPAEVVTGVTGVLHLFWAALGTLLFLRRRGLRTEAALIGAISWGFGGALVSKMQFPNMVQAASSLPWLLWGIEGVFARSRPVFRASVLALLLGLMLLAAHPQLFLMGFYLSAAWALWRLPELPRSQRLYALCLLFGALIVGGMLATAQLLPTIELARVSVRPSLTLAKANRFILPPYALLTNFLLPNFYGNPATPTEYVGRGNFWEPCAYGGVLPFALAVGAAVRLWKSSYRRDVRFFAVTAGICIWLSVGRDAGLYAVAFRLLPGVSRFHDAARWLLPGTFALACLAACGANAVLESYATSNRRRVTAAFFIALTAVDVLVFTHTLNPTAAPNEFAAARVPVAGMSSGWLFHADEGRVWSRYVSYRSYAVVGDAEHRRRLLASHGPNLSVLAGQGQIGGYEPVARADAWAYSRAALTSATLRRAAGVTATVQLPTESAPPRITVDPAALGRAQFWTRWQATQPAVLPPPNWDGTPRVEGEYMPLPPAMKDSGATAVLLQDISPQEVWVSLPPGHAAGLLVLTDTLHPGWTAWVDGAPVSLHRVDGVFRGVFASADARQIRLVHQPDSWRVGLFISLAGGGILSAVFAAHAVRGCLPASASFFDGVSTGLPDRPCR